ncbi:hypothetical protein Dda_9230 [Drechslerella dactyloides]|uniref:Uncharacterized protein n=1 Tax=Drechslerella dactyloides TaxID=74499 RepID=A0AAD6NF78_DREDA|nr:hypothetical protein Dda_9230 [Drechslerella dactyloides]
MPPSRPLLLLLLQLSEDGRQPSKHSNEIEYHRDDSVPITISMRYTQKSIQTFTTSSHTPSHHHPSQPGDVTIYHNRIDESLMTLKGYITAGNS